MLHIISYSSTVHISVHSSSRTVLYRVHGSEKHVVLGIGDLDRAFRLCSTSSHKLDTRDSSFLDMSLFPNQPDNEGLVFAIILAEVVAVAIGCCAVHYVSKHFYQYFFQDRFNALSEAEQRSTQSESTSTVLTLCLIPCFIAGAVELSASIDE